MLKRASTYRIIIAVFETLSKAFEPGHAVKADSIQKFADCPFCRLPVIDGAVMQLPDGTVHDDFDETAIDVTAKAAAVAAQDVKFTTTRLRLANAVFNSVPAEFNETDIISHIVRKCFTGDTISLFHTLRHGNETDVFNIVKRLHTFAIAAMRYNLKLFTTLDNRSLSAAMMALDQVLIKYNDSKTTLVCALTTMYDLGYCTIGVQNTLANTLNKYANDERFAAMLCGVIVAFTDAALHEKPQTRKALGKEVATVLITHANTVIVWRRAALALRNITKHYTNEERVALFTTNTQLLAALEYIKAGAEALRAAAMMTNADAAMPHQITMSAVDDILKDFEDARAALREAEREAKERPTKRKRKCSK